MGRSRSKYSDEQREGIVRAVRERGVTAEQAVELAAAGALDSNLDPFEMPAATARSILAKAERGRAAGELHGLANIDPAAVVRVISNARDALARDVERIKERGADHDLTAEELQRLRLALRGLREVQEFAKAIPRRAQAAQPKNEGTTLSERMQQDMERTAAANGTK